MTKEQIQNFSRRIAGCSRTELVVITYDIILTYISDGEECYNQGDEADFIFNYKKARQYVGELITNLNMDYSISYELLNLYLFINRSLFQSIMRKEPVNTKCIRDMIQKLRDSFEEVAKTDNSGVMYNNSKEVYAGFTYSKAGLNETVL